MSKHNIPQYVQKKAIRALERRFGQSVMPYAFRDTGRMTTAYGTVYRCTDTESGSWIEFDHASDGRLRVREEHDAADTADRLAA